MKTKSSLLIALALLIAMVASTPSLAQMKMEKQTKTLQETEVLKTNMRQLWEDHVTWTRNVILCIVDDLPGKDQAVKRLLQNQVDLGNAFKPFYGEEAGNKLTALLTPHITIAAEVVTAAKAGNTTALDESNKKWSANADELAEFLSKANPNWSLTEMKGMLHDHLKLTTDEAVQRIKKDYDADVVAYDKVHVEILKMSDMLTAGIIKQFPSNFKIVIKTASN